MSSLSLPRHTTVGNIPFDTTEGEVHSLLSQIGQIKNFRCVRVRRRAAAPLVATAPAMRVVVLCVAVMQHHLSVDRPGIAVLSHTSHHPPHHAADAAATQHPPTNSPTTPSQTPPNTHANNRLIMDRETGKPKGFGFCEFHSKDDAESAFRNLNGTMFKNRQIRIDYAEENMSDRGYGKPRGAWTAPVCGVGREAEWWEGVQHVCMVAVLSSSFGRPEGCQTDNVWRGCIRTDSPFSITPPQSSLNCHDRCQKTKSRRQGRRRAARPGHGQGPASPAFPPPAHRPGSSAAVSSPGREPAWRHPQQ